MPADDKGEPPEAGFTGRADSRGDANLSPMEPAQPITLIDETGRERQFQLHDAFDHEGAVYYLVENIDDPSQVLLLRESSGGLETVEGEEFQRVIAALEEDRVD